MHTFGQSRLTPLFKQECTEDYVSPEMTIAYLREVDYIPCLAPVREKKKHD